MVSQVRTTRFSSSLFQTIRISILPFDTILFWAADWKFPPHRPPKFCPLFMVLRAILYAFQPSWYNFITNDTRWFMEVWGFRVGGRHFVGTFCLRLHGVKATRNKASHLSRWLHFNGPKIWHRPTRQNNQADKNIRKVAGSIPAGVIGIFHWHKILPIALWPWGRLSL